MTTFDNSEILSGSTIDGTEIQEITIDGNVAWTAAHLGETADKPAPHASAILQDEPNAPDGYYYIETPNGVTDYVYCDMTTGGGGWMLMINVQSGDGGQYYGNNAYGQSTIDGESGVVEYNKNGTSMFSRSRINDFLSISGMKYGRITPRDSTDVSDPFTGLHQRIGTSTTVEWPGSLNECNNRTSLTNSTYDWVLTQYQNWSDVEGNVNGDTGDYDSSDHYYPTNYGSEQNFWKGNGDGIRFSTTFTGSDWDSVGQNAVSGYFWIKVV